MDRLVWKLTRRHLRILCYHGVCDDRLAEKPWMPLYFVTRSAFKNQLGYLKQHADVLPLSEAVVRLRDHRLPPRTVCITFDDGYANNLRLAYPVLREYGMPATVFLSTAYIQSGEFFPFLRLKLLRLAGIGPAEVPDYKSNPLDHVMEAIGRWWPEVSARLTSNQREALRPLTVDEVQGADSSLVEFGAHTDTHCILRNEDDQRRQREIRTSLDKVARWTGLPVGLFSYPNGEPGDFGEVDKAALQAAHVDAAVTGIAGSNNGGCDPFELKRYPLSMRHNQIRFRAEVTGFCSALRSAAGRSGV
jgi:peptidoglycan/xylan/chitin deacetylase (PgdA/CDA1 family)